MKFLITGKTGFIGKKFVSFLISAYGLVLYLFLA
jgi:nucleoside-diphosphate-sugar epimerase